MLSGIRDILIISTPDDILKFETLLGDGSKYGIKLSYLKQNKPEGIGQAFIIGKDFIGNDDVCLVLGDNIFYGKELPKLLINIKEYVQSNNNSMIFGYRVNDPQRYGVIEFDNSNNILSIIEKPTNPKSNYAVVGLYFYKNDVVNIANNIKPSQRGELEITDINLEYLNQKRLKANIMDAIFWLDTGTYESLTEASNFIKTIENREGKRVSCIEEIAFKYNYIDKKVIQKAIKDYDNEYGNYLKRILNDYD
tara:strand:- start:242 stop:994 length:753 start_codon:yes stop_codon:yes gene_type:complete